MVKNRKKSKIDDFREPSENPRKVVLGSLKIVKKCQKIVLWATKILFFDNNIVAASGRSQKRGGGLRPPPLFWTILLSKNSISVVNKNDILMIFDDFEAPEDDFSRIFRGSPEIVDFGFFFMIFDNSPGTLRNSSKYYFLTISNGFGVL